MGDNELSYCELRAKEVVNASDGKRMGRIIDILFSRKDGTISGIVVPLCKRSVFSKNQDVFIPWRCVQKIGEDVILVTLTVDADGRLSCGGPKPPPDKDRHGGHESHGHNKHESRENRISPDCCLSEAQPMDCADTPYPNCDFRCEKCMLFDCAYRWSQAID